MSSNDVLLVEDLRKQMKALESSTKSTLSTMEASRSDLNKKLTDFEAKLDSLLQMEISANGAGVVKGLPNIIRMIWEYTYDLRVKKIQAVAVEAFLKKHKIIAYLATSKLGKTIITILVVWMVASSLHTLGGEVSPFELVKKLF